MVTAAPHGHQKPSVKNNVLKSMYSTFAKITYALTFPLASLEQFLRAIQGAVSWATVLILAQTKLNS